MHVLAGTAAVAHFDTRVLQVAAHPGLVRDFHENYDYSKLFEYYDVVPIDADVTSAWTDVHF